WLAELRAAARELAADPAVTEKQLAAANAALALTTTNPEQLLDLTTLRAAGERAAGFEGARKRLEQAALDELAVRDKDLLQELLDLFAAEYAAAKQRESALDFEDLQLLARDLLANDAAVREEEQLRFRAAASSSVTSSSWATSSRRSTVSGTPTSPCSANGASARRSGCRSRATTALAPRSSLRSTSSSTTSSATVTSRSRRRASSTIPSSGIPSSCSSPISGASAI